MRAPSSQILFSLLITFAGFSGAVFSGASFSGCKKGDDTKAVVPPSTTSSSSQSTEDLGEVLATIDGVAIHVREFQNRINSQSPYVRARYTSKEQKKEFLDNLIRFEVLAIQARKEGFDKDPAVILSMKQLMIQKLMKDRLEKGIRPEDVTEDEMKSAYETSHDEFHMPEEFRVSAIVLDSKKSSETVAALALGEAGSSNKGFRELVAAHSTETTSKMRGGDLRYFTAQNTEIPGEVVQAAFLLKKTGDVAGPIKTQDGRYYIIKQTGHRKAISKTYEEVKRQLQNRIYREKRTQAQQDFVTKLKKDAKIEIFSDKLDQVQIDTSAAPADITDPHSSMKMPSPKSPNSNSISGSNSGPTPGSTPGKATP